MRHGIAGALSILSISVVSLEAAAKRPLGADRVVDALVTASPRVRATFRRVAQETNLRGATIRRNLFGGATLLGSALVTALLVDKAPELATMTPGDVAAGVMGGASAAFVTVNGWRRQALNVKARLPIVKSAAFARALRVPKLRRVLEGLPAEERHVYVGVAEAQVKDANARVEQARAGLETLDGQITQHEATLAKKQRIEGVLDEIGDPPRRRTVIPDRRLKRLTTRKQALTKTLQAREADHARWQARFQTLQEFASPKEVDEVAK